MIRRIDCVILTSNIHSEAQAAKDFHFYTSGDDIQASAQNVLDAGHLSPDDSANLADLLKIVDWSLGNHVVTLFGKSVARISVKEIKVF